MELVVWFQHTLKLTRSFINGLCKTSIHLWEPIYENSSFCYRQQKHFYFSFFSLFSIMSCLT